LAKKRLFVGTMVQIPNLHLVKEEMDKLNITGKWVERENLHFTYRFLGEIEEEKIPQIGLALKGRLKGIKPPKVKYRGLGVFRNRGIPKVLWIGIESDELNEVKRRIDQSLMVFGFSPEENFTPHVTLLRIKHFRHREKFNSYLFKMKDFLFAERLENKVSLVESKLTPSGPKYTILEEFILG